MLLYLLIKFRQDAWITDCSSSSLGPPRTERVLAVVYQPSPRPQIPQTKMCPHLSKRGPLGSSVKSERMSHHTCHGDHCGHRGRGLCEIRTHQPIGSESGLYGPVSLVMRRYILFQLNMEWGGAHIKGRCLLYVILPRQWFSLKSPTYGPRMASKITAPLAALSLRRPCPMDKEVWHLGQIASFVALVCTLDLICTNWSSDRRRAYSVFFD